MGKWLAAFTESTSEMHVPCTDITDSTHKKYVTSVLSVRHFRVKDEKNQAQVTSDSDRWDPELATEGYVWCLDCQHFNGVNCNHTDNPFHTVTKCPKAPRKCQWYEKNL